MHASSGEGFEQLGFAPEFDVEVAPEFPGGGLWPYPVYAFNEEGQVTRDVGSTRGTPRVLVIRPRGGVSWSSSRGLGLTAAAAMPNPRHLCVAVKGATYVVDVDRPQRGAVVGWAQQLVGMSDPTLLLAASETYISSYGTGGLAWRSPRVAIDGLRVVAAQDGTIAVSEIGGDGHGTSALTDLDAYTGQVVRRG